MISIHMPAPRLAGHVLCHVSRTDASPGDHETVFPSSFYAALTITHRGTIVDSTTDQPYPPVAVCGPQTRPKRLRYEARTVATTTIFKPGRLTTLTGAPASAVLDAIVDVSSVLDATFCDRLHELRRRPAANRSAIAGIESLLMGQLDRSASQPPFLDRLQRVIARIPSMRVHELSSHFDLVPRSLQRRFTSELGMPPKTFGRLVRLHETLWRIQTTEAAQHNWAHLASQTGFADQSHLHREFRALVGLSPTELLADLAGAQGQIWAFQLPPAVTGWCHADGDADPAY